MDKRYYGRPATFPRKHRIPLFRHWTSLILGSMQMCIKIVWQFSGGWEGGEVEMQQKSEYER